MPVLVAVMTAVSSTGAMHVKGSVPSSMLKIGRRCALVSYMRT